MEYTELRTLMADKEKWSSICHQTEFLNQIYPKVSGRQRVWHVEHNIFNPLSCPICGKIGLGFSNKLKQYSKYCNSTCAQKDPATRRKTESTCFEKYGVKSNLCLPENKAKEEATKLSKYGVKNYTQTAEFKLKVKATSLLRYGVENPSQSQQVKDKVNDTSMRLYGRKRSSQCHIPLTVIDLKNDRTEMSRWFNELKMPVSEIAKVLGINGSQLTAHFKNNLNIDITRHGVSWPERKIQEFLTSIGVTFQTSDRKLLKPKELDIIIPSAKVAIELNGVAWHSENRGKAKNYHSDKTVACEKIGYRLVHIWSTEWATQQELVKSRLKSILGVSSKIMARKCQIKIVSSLDAKNFLNANHMQGYCQSTIRYGLYSDNILTALMTFGKSRFSKSVEWELLRYCTAQGVNIAGGPSKLFAHFIKIHNPSSVISYCDRRWNTGKLYQNLKFVLSSISSPNYWYTKNHAKLESRLRYQKHKLAKILETFDPSLTEWENMQANGYDRIWDCGNSVWIWQRPSVVF